MNNHSNKYNDSQSHLSEEALLRYKEGKMTDAEMHKVEMHLLNCELCSEAYEGIVNIEANKFKAEVSQLKKTYRHKNSTKKESAFNWKWVAAASLVLILLVSFGILIVNGPLEETESARSENTTKNENTNRNETTNEAIVENEPIVAENIQDTIINHHISLNDPVSSGQEEKKKPAAPVYPSPLITDQNVLVDTIIPDEEEILALTEDFPETSEKPENLDKEITEDKLNSKPMPDFPVTRIGERTRPGIISGKVVDEEGTPLPGVNVIVKGTTKGAITDLEGNYEIPVSSEDQILVFSSIGYASGETKILNEEVNTFTLKPDIHSLSEVVVTGYGKHSAVSGDISEKKINPRPAIGMRKFRQYVKENIRYPEAARQNKVEDQVMLQILVNANGTISDISVIKSAGYGLDEEAIRLIKSGPDWQPARINDKPVAETVQIKIPFKLKKE